MAWTKLYPTSATKISQSVTQIQDNWAYIETTLQEDHYFANALASNDGHHKFVHLPTVADQAVLLKGVIYQKLNAAGKDRLYYRTPALGGAAPLTRIEQIPTALTGQVVLPVGLGPHTVLNFNGYPNFMGVFTAYKSGSPADRCSASIFYNGTKVKTVATAQSGAITSVTDNDGHILQITKTNAAMTLNYSIIKVER